jgi:hypothetical protein
MISGLTWWITWCRSGTLDFTSTDILSSEQPELDTDCEIIWAKVDIIGVKSIYIGAYYKPQENDIESINELSRSLQRIPINSHTWLLGDFNLLKYDWVKQEYKPNCKFINTYKDGFYTYYIYFCPDDFAISVQLRLF